MSLVRLQSGTVHLRDGDATACGLPAFVATEVSPSGRTGMCARCLRVESIRGTLRDRAPGANRMALIRELVEVRARNRGGDGQRNNTPDAQNRPKEARK